MSSYTIPRRRKIGETYLKVPQWMWPNPYPHAVVSEGYLNDSQCDAIIEEMDKLEPYEFHGCNAITRESPRPLPDYLNPILERTFMADFEYWNFVVVEAAAWYQTYRPGDSYQIHSDSMIGTTRKLTTIALLSDHSDYRGGELRVIPHPEYEVIPKTRGTLVTFPAWLLHEVLPVTWGTRKTLNLGMYGPPFK